jgi:predicted membrane chloride channel (bestrophin family)
LYLLLLDNVTNVELVDFTQGAAERIANTLVPHAYSLLVFRIIVFYMGIAPLAMVSAINQPYLF